MTLRLADALALHLPLKCQKDHADISCAVEMGLVHPACQLLYDKQESSCFSQTAVRYLQGYC